MSAESPESGDVEHDLDWHAVSLIKDVGKVDGKTAVEVWHALQPLIGHLTREHVTARQAEALREAAVALGSGPTMRVLVERESCDWWTKLPVARWLHERANMISPPAPDTSC